MQDSLPARRDPQRPIAEEVTSPPGDTIMSNIAAADNLNKNNAIPAGPRGNMVNSLCMVQRD